MVVKVDTVYLALGIELTGKNSCWASVLLKRKSLQMSLHKITMNSWAFRCEEA